MIIIKEKSKCSGCYACSSICPQKCIQMSSDNEGFWYPEVIKDKCTNCGLCEKVCPIMNIKEIENNPISFAAYNKNETIRLDSSSGGIFTPLAEYIIKQGGIVFGASFNDKFEVEHGYVNCVDDLSKLRGSKYVQSRINIAYIQAKEFLEEGRMVLFTGTPCQIAGLKEYLGKEYRRLYCQDFICHGVPSPKVWHKYVLYREKCCGSSTCKIIFREKERSWKQCSIFFLFNNDTKHCQIYYKDLMMIAFLRNTSLRPSCYDCSFKTLNRQSDVTLADFWGIQNIMPEMDDDKGTSLLIINSSKGQELVDQIKEQIVMKEADLNEAIKYNSSMISSVAYNSKREGFFNDLDSLEFDKLVEKYCTDKCVVRVKKKVQDILSKTKHLFLKKTRNTCSK